MWSLRPEHFKLIYSCLPPPAEQAVIVRFLDHVDRRIRSYIRGKQKLIKLLEEQKEAIIHCAVTRGLDPNVRLKPSGVEWLGDVPEHWDVRRLKYLSNSIQMGPFGASLTELQSQDTGYKLFGQENTISGDFTKGQRWVTKAQYEALRRYELLPGDLVLTRKGSIGKCKMVPFDAAKGIADSDTIRVRLDHAQVFDRFIVVLLQDAAYVKRQIESVQRGAILAGLNTATIGNLCVAVPPLREQTVLLSKIDAGTSVVSSAIADALHEIALLREFRTRLIADVVTGKLDVREAAADLPDELDERELLDEAESANDVDADVADELAAIPEEAEA
jgi:type I restriction enzyme S subunit